jgi:predicted  nucleic acid-binding Zn-ribbon protein
MARARSAGNGRLEEAQTALSREARTTQRQLADLSQEMRALAQSQACLMQNQTALMQNQTALMQQHTAFPGQIREGNALLVDLERRTEERFRRIEAILLDHSRILHNLPEAIREKIGFRPPAPTAAPQTPATPSQ